MMAQDGFPRELLKQTVEQRSSYFESYTMAHPRLSDAYKELISAIYNSPGVSLIFLFGPTGVGKTTLLRRLKKKLIEAALPDLEADKGRIPIVGIEAMSPEFSQFDWKDFYIRTLKALKEPLINHKISYRDTKLKLRHAVEAALVNRQPEAFYIDEAHHLAKLASGRKLKDQPEALKSLSSLGRVRIVMAGTYDLMPLIDLGDQLCRRSKSIHFSRYDANCDEDAKAFKSVLQTFQSYLPLEEEPDLVQHWEYCYAHSVGCVGVLKDWLSQTLSAVLNENEQASTITLKNLERHAQPVRKSMLMLKTAQKGEAKLTETTEEVEQLYAALGFFRKSQKPECVWVDKGGEQQHNTTNSGRKRGSVGQPNPKRYEVGGH